MRKKKEYSKKGEAKDGKYGHEKRPLSKKKASNGGRPRIRYENQLTHKQFLAIEYYMRGMSMKDSLLKAGYSETTAVNNPQAIFACETVQREIEKRRWALKSRNHEVIDRIQDELAKIAFFNIGNVSRITEDGELIIDFDEATWDDLAAIGEVTVEEYKDGRGRDAVSVKKFKVKPYDKKAALDSLCRIHGMFNDKLSLGTEEDLEKRLQRGRARAGKRPSGELNDPDTIDGEYEDVSGIT